MYLVGDISVRAWSLDISFAEMSVSGWDVGTLWEAFLLTTIGIPLASILIHLMNGVAFLQDRLARVMLGKLH